MDTPVSKAVSYRRILGVLLLVAAIIVGCLWATSHDPNLEPIAFILVTAGGLLML